MHCELLRDTYRTCLTYVTYVNHPPNHVLSIAPGCMIYIRRLNMPPNANVEIGYAGMSKSAKFFFSYGHTY